MMTYPVLRHNAMEAYGGVETKLDAPTDLLSGKEPMVPIG
jgi:hypothetical protein